MVQSEIETLIKQQTGIDPAIVGSGLIASAVERRMRAHQITELADYWTLLQQQDALQQLIDTVVVPETWFFRDRSPFEFLANYVKSLLKKKSLANDILDQPVRILSLPCSTGEEPYSIAMALLNAEIDPTRFKIDAIDISQQNIQQALGGVYQRISFRNDDTDFQAQFFEQIGEAYHLHDRVKQTVQFRVGNILQPHTLPTLQPYDVIFCRNLLIYFASATRQQVLQQLHLLLKATGVLFVGHAESSLLLNAGWQGSRIPFTFAYQKPKQQVPKAIPIATQPTIASATQTTSAVAIQKPGNENATIQNNSIQDSAVNLASSDSTNHLDRLKQARQLADRGELTQAQQICTQLIQEFPLQSEVYLLLGQVHQAQDQDSMAETYFRKSLYLQPDSLDALLHLARLKEKRGERSSANRLYQRIERLKATK